MNILQQSAQVWNELTEYKYLFIYGSKKHLHNINLTFALEDYPHLAGFQYMKDISLPNFSSKKIVERIIEGKVSFETIQQAANYGEKIRPRLDDDSCNIRTTILNYADRNPVISGQDS